MANVMTVTTQNGQRVKQGEVIASQNISVSGGVKVFSNTPNAFKITDTAYQDDSVTVQAKFTLPTLPKDHSHIGKKAELFTVGFYSPINGVCSGKKNDESRDHYYQLVNHIKDNSNQQDNSWYDAWNRRSAPLNDFVEWNGSLDSLKPFKDITLQAENTIEVMTNSKFPLNITGKLCFTFGYRVTVETNKEEWVFNNTSVDLNFIKVIIAKKITDSTVENKIESGQPNTPIITVPAGIASEGTTISIIQGKNANGDTVWSFITDKALKGEVTVTLPDPDVDPNASQSTVTRRSSTTEYSCEKNSYPIGCSIPDGIACIGEETANWYCKKAYFYGHRLPTLSFKVTLVGSQTVTEYTNSNTTEKRVAELSSSCNFLDTKCFQGKIPVLFVHGYKLSMEGVDLGGGKGTFGEFPKLVQELNKDRYVLFEFRWSTEARFEDAAYDLGKAIEKIKEKTGNPVHIIAHSFGGVLTRTYLQGLAEKYMYPGDFLTTLPYKQGTVASVTTAGTPHSGIFDGQTTFGTTAFEGKEEFSPGQDSSTFELCKQISCYQAGEPVVDLDKVNFKLENTTEGYLMAKLADFTKHPLPDLPIQVLIGLTAKDRNTECVERLIDNLACIYNESLIGSGDGLISYEGQRFAPQLTSDGIKPLLSGMITEKILGEFTAALPISVDRYPLLEAKRAVKFYGGVKQPQNVVKPGDALLILHNYQNGDGWGYKHADDLTGEKRDEYLWNYFATRNPPYGEVFIDGNKCTSATDCQHDTFLKVRDWLEPPLGFKVKNEQGSYLNEIFVNNTQLKSTQGDLFESRLSFKDIDSIRANVSLPVTLSHQDYLPKTINLKTEIDALLAKTAVYTLVEKPVTLTFKAIDESNNSNPLNAVNIDVVGVGSIGQTRDGGILPVEVKKSILKPPYTLNLSKSGYETKSFTLDLATINNAISLAGLPIVYGLKAVQPTKFDVTIKACEELPSSRRVVTCTPLEGNTMIVIIKNGVAVSSTTVTNGVFTIPLEKGTYGVSVSNLGYNNVPDQSITVAEAPQERRFDLLKKMVEIKVPSPTLTVSSDAPVPANTIKVSWTAVAEAQQYFLYRDGLLFKKISELSFDDVTTQIKEFCYTVVAIDKDGNRSDKSIKDCATPKPAVTKPAAPTGLTATAGVESISLKWNAISGATYLLHIEQSDGYTLGTIENYKDMSNNTSFVHESLNSNMTYFYSVAAVLNGIQSDFSPTVNAKPLAKIVTPTRPIMPSTSDAYVVFSDTSCFTESLSTAEIPTGWISRNLPLETKCKSFSVKLTTVENLGCAVTISKLNVNSGVFEVTTRVPEKIPADAQSSYGIDVCTSNYSSYQLGGTGTYRVSLDRLDSYIIGYREKYTYIGSWDFKVN